MIDIEQLSLEYRREGLRALVKFRISYEMHPYLYSG